MLKHYGNDNKKRRYALYAEHERKNMSPICFSQYWICRSTSIFQVAKCAIDIDIYSDAVNPFTLCRLLNFWTTNIAVWDIPLPLVIIISFNFFPIIFIEFLRLAWTPQSCRRLLSQIVAIRTIVQEHFEDGRYHAVSDRKFTNLASLKSQSANMERLGYAQKLCLQ